VAKYDFMSMPPSPFQPPAVVPTLEKLVRIWEKLRDLNTGGYGSGVLAQIEGEGRGWPSPNGRGLTSCSPFTGTALGMLLSEGDGPPYKPLFDGRAPLPGVFYTMQNGDLSGDCRKFLQAHKVDLKAWRLDNTLQDSAGAACWFNLAEPIGYCRREPSNGKCERFGNPEKLRRGDLLKIEWYSKEFPVKDEKTGAVTMQRITSGHATFCWDVHLDAQGNVDAFQFLSANGTHSGGVGISAVATSADGVFVKRDGKKYVKLKPNFTDILDGKDYPEVAEGREWYAMPDIAPGSIDTSTFRRSDPKKKIVIKYWSDFLWAREIKVARLRGFVPPEPYPQPAPGSKPATPEKQFVAKPTKVPGAEAAKDPKAIEKVPHEKTAQLPDAGASFQHEVEELLQTFYAAKWITSNPGNSTDVNDASSQAAIKEFQEKFTKGKATGHADPDTRTRLRFFAPYARKQKVIEQQLAALKAAGKLSSGPEAPDDERDDASTAALKEFQKKADLDDDGIPGPKTCGALDEAVARLAAPDAAKPEAAKPDAAKPGAARPADAGCPNEEALRKKILEVARAEVGMRCDDNYIDSAGRIPTYFEVAFDHRATGAYCAAFAIYCWRTAGVQFKGSAWVPKLLRICEQQGRLLPADGPAKPGDLAFIVGPGATRSGKKNRDGDDLDQHGNVWPSHVGLVAEVKDGKVTKTIEGNWYRKVHNSGVYEVSPASYHEGRLVGFGSLIGLGASAPKAVDPGKPIAPAKSPTPAQPPKPRTQAPASKTAAEKAAKTSAQLAPDEPLFLWRTTYAKGGEIVELRLHAAGLAVAPTTPLVMLFDPATGKALLPEATGSFAVFPEYRQFFIAVPHLPDGSQVKASVNVLREDGSRLELSTPGPLTIGTHTCPECEAVRAIGDDAAFAHKVHASTEKSPADGKSVTAVQRLLVKFGYDLGKTKAHPDGADGSLGDAGARALRWFVREASHDAEQLQVMDPFWPDAKAPVVSLFTSACAQGFKKSWPRAARASGGDSHDPRTPEAGRPPPITSGRIQVHDKPFPTWFNKEFQPTRNVPTGISGSEGKPRPFFESTIDGDNFRKLFDSIAVLSGQPETPLAEFVAFFCVFYNEQGGTFLPKPEGHGYNDETYFNYFFKQVEGGKISYNVARNKQKLAGDQLFAWGHITKDEVATWNVATPFPLDKLKARPELGKWLRECDFYKFQGRGLTQITWREGFEKYVVPALREAGGYETDLDKLTTDQLEQAMQDPKVYLRAVYHEWHAGGVGRALPDANLEPPEFYWIGRRIGGSGNYGRLFHKRCVELRRAMIAAGYSCA
jgi:peptidoglycan hydrolase-like protein with peptidoglycan-binding domain